MRNIRQSLLVDAGYGLELHPARDTATYDTREPPETFTHIGHHGNYLGEKFLKVCKFYTGATLLHVLTQVICF